MYLLLLKIMNMIFYKEVYVFILCISMKTYFFLGIITCGSSCHSQRSHTRYYSHSNNKISFWMGGKYNGKNEYDKGRCHAQGIHIILFAMKIYDFIWIDFDKFIVDNIMKFHINTSFVLSSIFFNKYFRLRVLICFQNVFIRAIRKRC